MKLSERSLLKKNFIGVHRENIGGDFIILKVAHFIKEEFGLENILDVTIKHCIRSNFLNEDAFRKQIHLEANSDKPLLRLLKYGEIFMRLTGYQFGRGVSLERGKYLGGPIKSLFGKHLGDDGYASLFDDYRIV